MNTYHLKYFYDVFHLKSVVAAAKANHVAPSTVSQALKALEDQLGMKLTEKTRGQLTLTDHAHQLAPKIPLILTSIENLKPSNKTESSELTGSHRIATHQSLLASLLWKPLREFRKMHPKVDFKLVTGVGSHLAEMLAEKQVDLAITLDAIDSDKNLRSEILYAGNFMAVAKPGISFNKKTPVFISKKTKPEVQYLLRHNPWIAIEEELTNWSTIKNVILSENAVGFLPDYLVKKELLNGKLQKISSIKKQNYAFQVRSWQQRSQASDPKIKMINKMLISRIEKLNSSCGSR